MARIKSSSSSVSEGGSGRVKRTQEEEQQGMEEKGKEYEERRGRGRGRGRGRPRGRAKAPPRGLRVKKRNMIESEEEDDAMPDENEPPKAKQYDQDCDISSLEAPTFTTLDRGPPAPMLRLSWDHPVNLIGEKVLSPRIHICDSCNKPILIYGRMIPCKHVFCLWCARSDDRVCARCSERVARVEQTGLGTVFMCNYTINKAVCKRTYLSQRDLQAHIDHRHMKMSGTAGPPKEDLKEERLSHRDPRGEGRESRGDARPDPRSLNDPRIGKEGFDHRESYSGNPQFPRQAGQFGSSIAHTQAHQSPSSHQGSSHNISLIPVMTSSRTNLITVPIQDPPEHSATHPSFPHPTPTHPPPTHITPTHPPPSHSFTSPPPAHSQPQTYSTSFTAPYSHSSQHTTQPSHHTTQPSHHTTQPSHHNTQPSHHNTQPSHHTTQPSHHTTQPSHHTTQPSHHTTQPSHHTTQPSHHTTQSSHQYTYASNPVTASQQTHTVPPSLYSSVASTVPPPTTYSNRPQYEGQYGTTQWSTPPPQQPPSHQSASTIHHSSLSSVQSSQYYRKSF